MRSAGRLLVGIVAALGLISFAAVIPASAAQPLSWERLAGPDRYGTAARVSHEAFPNGAPAAVVASGEFFADGLSASYLAGRVGGPLLLTRSGALPEATIDELSRLGVGKIYVMGGATAVSGAVVDALKSLPTSGGPMAVERIFGEDRYATAVAAATQFGGDTLPLVGGKRTALLAGGRLFADALSASAAAAGGGLPLLLTDPKALSPGVLGALKKVGVEAVVVLGGEAAVSKNVADALAGAGMRVTRLGGTDRVETSALMADWTVDELGFDARQIGLARGDDAGLGVDALAGGPFIGARGHGHPLLLTASPSQPGQGLLTWIGKHSELTGGYVFGGPASVSQSLLDQLGSGAGPVATPPVIITTTLPDATIATAYHQTVKTKDGEPGTWVVTAGTLPDGLTLGTSTGAITGTPTAGATSQTFTVTFTDAQALNDTQELTILIAPLITTTSLPDAATGDAYSATLTRSGGRPPGTWAVSTGTLPDGLTLAPTTGVITGTPTTAVKAAPFTITFTDSDGLSDAQALTLTVNGPWLSVTTGDFHTCGIRADGTAWCWGVNAFGQVGDGTTTINGKRSPVAVDDTDVTGTRWTSVSPGGFHTCGVRDDSTAWCWGANTYGELGNGTTADSDSPVEVKNGGVGGGWVTLTTGRFHSCGLQDDGSAWCWGNNSLGGQLGNGTAGDTDSPVKVDTTGVAGSAWTSLTIGGNDSCGLRDDGSAWCWGGNPFGQLGNGTLTDSHSPVEVKTTGVGGSTWTSLTNGEQHTCGIRDNGSGWCWGEGNFGELGDGNGINSSVPIPIQTSSGGWKLLEAGALHSCGIRDDGTAWCWGSNSKAQVGNGDVASVTSPVAVVASGLSGSDWTSVSAGGEHSCGLRDDGTAWCWGSNLFGQLGAADTVAGSAVPVAVDEP